MRGVYSEVNTYIDYKKIRAVFFDFGGTLYELNDEIIDIWISVLSASGIVFNLEHFFKGLMKARTFLDKYMIKKRFNRDDFMLSENEWIYYNSIILESLCPDINIIIDLSYKISETIAKVKHKYKIIDRVKESLYFLRIKYYLGLISNISYDIRDYLIKDGIISLFDVIGLSYELGMWKPDVEIFKICCSKVGLLPSEILYVGDSIYCDLMGSKQAGMIPIFINYHNVQQDVTFSINNISDLIPLLTGD